MSYYLEKIQGPYDYRSLIKAYVYTKRSHVDEDFSRYYKKLYQALSKAFDISFNISFENKDQDVKELVLLRLFSRTIRSLNSIDTPWSNYLEAGLVHEIIHEAGEAGQLVDKSSQVIIEIAEKMEEEHYRMLDHLFVCIFGKTGRIVTSKELYENGCDDSKQPEISDYYDHF